MSILQLPTLLAAQNGVFPQKKRMVSTDSLATITTAGYLNSVDLQSNPIQTTDIIEAFYSFVQNTNSGTYGEFAVTISNGVITLVPVAGSGDVILPVVSGDYAVFSGTSGAIADSGQAPTSSDTLFVVNTDGGVITGNIPSFTDTNGTLIDSGITANRILTTSVTSPVSSSSLTWHDVTCTEAALATAGHVNIQVGSGTQQFVVRDIRMNYSASGLSGGSGNRLLAVTDGTNVFNNAGITAALLGTPINTVWGGTGNPLPGTLAMDTPSVAGANIYAQYTGGTIDYTTGSVVISVLLQQVA